MAAKLSIANISHAFQAPDSLAPLPVLDDVSIDVAEGEFVSVIGASGSGKTTLLRIVAGLEQPRSGVVRIDGEPRGGPGGKMGVVFQRDSLWPWRSVLGNAVYGLEMRGVEKRAAEETAMRYIEMVGLRGYENYFPHQLSGGMRQRVNLARALAIEPDILLMDEPFAALDAQTREIMQLELTRIWRDTGKTVLFITHQIDEAVFLSDRVVTLSARPGAVRAVTPIDIPRPRDLRTKRTDVFQSYVGGLWDMIEQEVLKSFNAKLETT